MPEEPFLTTRLQGCLARVRAGDRAARDELVAHFHERLRRLTAKMLRGYPGVGRWDQTEDVLQDALLRLLRAVEEVEPGSVREFFGLAALQVRRVLLDRARRYRGLLARYESRAGAAGADRADSADGPAGLAAWGEFHEQIDRLPPEEREVVDLLFYQGVRQAEAAALLGVTVRTVQRRWAAALVKLHDLVKGDRPGP